jgi:hypothetical protein
MDVAYAYQATHSDKGWLNFLWRWQPLKERAHFSSEESRASREKRHEQTAREMAVACEEAGLSDCLAKARGSDKGYGVKPDVADAYFAESWEKLKTTKSSDPRYAAVVYWVKHLWPDCITKEDRIERLTRLGFSIGEPDRETCRSITAPLSPDLSVGWFDSHWGRLEFLKRLKAGWVRGASCAAGDEQIPSVIDQADEYLKKYPKSDISEAVRLERAAAYESWWSAQLFKKQELSSKDPRLSKARESAIQHYEEYLKTHPDNTDVKRSLYYLRNNIDSENRPHYCDPESYC